MFVEKTSRLDDLQIGLIRVPTDPTGTIARRRSQAIDSYLTDAGTRLYKTLFGSSALPVQDESLVANALQPSNEIRLK